MNLIDYSDSDDSGDETKPGVAPPAAKPAPKAAFQKVVDRSNPSRIKLSLPGASKPQTEKDDIESEAPPVKKARTGAGAFSGFNAMLPAPKKPKLDAPSGHAASGKRALGKGLGAGVSLKTGAEPAFRREPKDDLEEYDENGNPVRKEARKQEDFRALLNLPPPKTETKPAERPSTDTPTAPEPVTKPATRPFFMPIGMARGKKKKPVARPGAAVSVETKTTSTSNPSSNAPASEPKPPAKPKISLFSISQESQAPSQQPTGDYEPLIYGTNEDAYSAPTPDSSIQPQQTQSSTSQLPPASNDLTNIASELNLTAAERRQLFGRKGQGPDLGGAKIVSFNTDQEYAHNEMLRQQGETVQHNALKSISGTGKNSLKGLINMAATQKDALEEHFASGRRNKREAGNKYGW